MCMDREQETYASCLSPAQILRMRAEGIIMQHLANGALLLANSTENTLSKLTYVEDGHTEQELARIDDLDRDLKSNPKLKQTVIDLMVSYEVRNWA